MTKTYTGTVTAGDGSTAQATFVLPDAPIDPIPPDPGPGPGPGQPGDGTAGAPSGAAQYPAGGNTDYLVYDTWDGKLLSTHGITYAIKPTWNLAGRDFRVGVPEGKTLKPYTALKNDFGSNITIDGRGVVIWPNPVTIDGYDFTGTNVIVQAPGCTLKNSLFHATQMNGGNGTGRWIYGDDQSGAQAKNLSIINCTFDGSGIVSAAGGSKFPFDCVLQLTSSGLQTVQYCHFKKLNGHPLTMGTTRIDPPNSQSFDIRWNLFDEQNPTNTLDNESHANFLQNGYGNPNASGVCGSLICDYNVVINHYNYGQGSAFFQINSANGSCSNNTLLSRPYGPAGAGPACRIPVMLDPASAGSYWSGKIANNFIDPSGIWDPYGQLWTMAAPKAQVILGTDATNGSWGPRKFNNSTGNKNMRNGKEIAIPSCAES